MSTTTVDKEAEAAFNYLAKHVFGFDKDEAKQKEEEERKAMEVDTVSKAMLAAERAEGRCKTHCAWKAYMQWTREMAVTAIRITRSEISYLDRANSDSERSVVMKRTLAQAIAYRSVVHRLTEAQTKVAMASFNKITPASESVRYYQQLLAQHSRGLRDILEFMLLNDKRLHDMSRDKYKPKPVELTPELLKDWLGVVWGDERTFGSGVPDVIQQWFRQANDMSAFIAGASGTPIARVTRIVDWQLYLTLKYIFAYYTRDYAYSIGVYDDLVSRVEELSDLTFNGFTSNIRE